MTVKEGGPSQEIKIQATVPPALFCLAAGKDSDCTVAVKASTESMERSPPTCSQGILVVHCKRFKNVSVMNLLHH